MAKAGVLVSLHLYLMNLVVGLDTDPSHNREAIAIEKECRSSVLIRNPMLHIFESYERSWVCAGYIDQLEVVGDCGDVLVGFVRSEQDALFQRVSGVEICCDRYRTKYG
jgi:hypothetical protein